MAMKKRDRIFCGEIGCSTCSVIEAVRRLLFELSRNCLQPSFGVKERNAPRVHGGARRGGERERETELEEERKKAEQHGGARIRQWEREAEKSEQRGDEIGRFLPSGLSRVR